MHVGFVIAVAVLIGRALDMQVLHSEFFEQQGDARQLRVVPIPAHRGQIVDRNGEPFAVSTPVSSIWVNPKKVVNGLDQLPRLAKVLSMDARSLQKKILDNSTRSFVYLKRHVPPEQAKKLMD